MNDPKHYTDSHLVSRGSSVDIIERCMAFCRQSADFEGIVDYGSGEKRSPKFKNLIKELQAEAFQIAHFESKPPIVR